MHRHSVVQQRSVLAFTEIVSARVWLYNNIHLKKIFIGLSWLLVVCKSHLFLAYFTFHLLYYIPTHAKKVIIRVVWSISREDYFKMIHGSVSEKGSLLPDQTSSIPGQVSFLPCMNHPLLQASSYAKLRRRNGVRKTNFKVQNDCVQCIYVYMWL